MHAAWPFTRLGARLHPVQTVLGRLNVCLLAVLVIYGCSVKLRVSTLNPKEVHEYSHVELEEDPVSWDQN